MSLFLICAYFTWLAVQNLALPWAYRQHLLSEPAIVILMAAKEVILVGALVLLLYRGFRKDLGFKAPDKFALAYILLLVSYLVFAPYALGSKASFGLRMISLRSVISLALFYFWGRLSFLGIGELRRLIQFVVGLQMAVAGFGLVEWFFLPTSFWSSTVGVGAFMLDVKGLLEGQNVANGLPSNMFQFGVRRLISTYGDPLAMGIAGVFPLLVCLGRLWRPGPRVATQLASWRMAALLIAAALLLTLGRESIGAAVLGIALLAWWSGQSRRLALPLGMAAIALLLLPPLWTHLADTVTFREASAATHARILYSSWQQIPGMLVGKGLGEAGGWAVSLAGVRSEVGENLYLDLMAQTGALSVLLLVGFLLATARAAFAYARKFPDPLISVAFLAAAAHIVSRSALAIFSPSLFGVVPLASFFFLCGAGSTTMQRIRSQSGLRARRVLVLRPANGSSSEPAVGLHRIRRDDRQEQ
jgi:hypothetical protein